LSDDLAIARREAEGFNAEADRYRADLSRGRVGVGPTPGTVGHLIALYRAHDDFRDLALATRRGYLQSLRVLEELLGDSRLEAVTPPVAQALKRRFAAHAWQANAHLRVLRLLFSFARREGYHRGDNPVTAFRQLRVRPRTQIWTPANIARWCDGAPPELVAALRLALRTCQRQLDVLRLAKTRLVGDILHFTQSKTGEDVWIPAGSDLLSALAAHVHDATTILAAPGGRPWRPDHFRHAWRKRTLAAGLDGLQFRDLRRTGITELHEAGCTPRQIAAVSGHSHATIVQMLDTYAPTRAADARAAFVRLDDYRESNAESNMSNARR
jgi:integrase